MQSRYAFKISLPYITLPEVESFSLLMVDSKHVLDKTVLLSSYGRSDRSGDLLERPLELVILSHPMLSPLLADHVFDHHLLGHFLEEAANEARVPQFTGDAQVFAAAHQSIGLAALGSGGDAIGVKVLLFAACNGDESCGYISKGTNSVWKRRDLMIYEKETHTFHQLPNHIPS